MSRFGTQEKIYVKPSNDMYTALAGAATLVVLIGLILLVVKSQQIGLPVLGGQVTNSPSAGR